MNEPLRLALEPRARSANPAAAPTRAVDDTASTEHRAKVQEAAEKFESFFIAQILRQMRESTRAMAGEDGVFNSRGNQEMLDMADLALADSLAGHRAFGIADVIVRQLLPAPRPVDTAPDLKSGQPPVALES